MLRSAVRALLPRWFATQKHQPARAAGRSRRACLALEALEDRAAPAVISVNSLADLATPATGVVTLRSAIATANTNGDASNTIDLAAPGTYRLAQGELSITANSNLTIQNTSHGTTTVDAGGLSRAFDINAAAQNTTPYTVTFQGLTIQDGVASPGDGPDGSGGGIRAQGAASVVLNAVVLQHNTATADGGGISLESANNDGIGTLTITNSTVSNNHAGDAGGGVESDGTGTITINGSTISDNTCINQGAGVWLDAGTANLNMTGDIVSGNQALFMLGGGIGNAGSGNVTLTGCTIANNSSGSSVEVIDGTPTLVPGTGGGFADAANVGNLTVTNCLFLDNTAAGNGAAIQEGGPTTTITGTVFQGNISGGMGGAAFLNGVNAILTNDVIAHNVGIDGGAIEADANMFTATSCTFQANDAQGTADGTDGSGGAIEIQEGNTAAPNDLLANCLFLSNTANNGATGNGGAVNLLAGALETAECQFTNNVTAGTGGAIDAAGTSLFAFGSTFNGNQATGGSGGAIAVATTNASTLELSTFVGNTASINGGAIFADGSSLDLIADTINGNSCGNIGGGVSLLNGGTLTSGDTIVFGNSAGFGAADVFSVTVTDNGGNLIGVNPPTFNAGTLTSNPKLGPLENNGGPHAGAFSDAQVLQTEALLPGSPAIGAGVNGLTEVPLDERFFPSPAVGRANVSIGAFEPQYASTATANQVFVESATEVLLNQPASAASATSLVNWLNHGNSRTSVVKKIEATSTYKTIEVNGLFQLYLNRQPTAAELKSYLTMLSTGSTLEQLGATLAGTTEFFNLHGGTNVTFIEGAFEITLNGPPSAAEVFTFEQQLAGGASHRHVALALLSSTEYRANLVSADFQSLLGRAPTGTELAFYVMESAQGGTDQLLFAQILGLQESFANRT